MKTIGVFGLSNKKNEKRIPLHPLLYEKIPDKIKPYLLFEDNYAQSLGVTNSYLRENFGGVFSRSDLYKKSDVWLLPKPVHSDFEWFQEGKILWGWPHCVQGREITQVAIEKKMTLIAWEAMHTSNDNVHVFHRNNELAGYASVQHMMMISGKTGYFGHPLKAAVLGFGATGRGAVNSLISLGIQDTTVFSRRSSSLINDPIEGITYKRLKKDLNSCYLEDQEDTFVPAILALKNFDIIVNCVLQDPTSPLMFIENQEHLELIQHKMDIIDVSCDTGMGFFFAEPTSFDSPTISINNSIEYYSVDHTPSLYWNSASYEITKSILDFIPYFVNNSWKSNKTLLKALEIENGVVINKNIISFQNRESSFPYPVIKS